ncbi:hypothetical protein FRAHR75_1160018 [Frankia sp. Hr75.2]|nr:hypothetical protein FRAHR75_1160018 [Frankia sp. Hr75.2]
MLGISCRGQHARRASRAGGSAGAADRPVRDRPGSGPRAERQRDAGVRAVPRPGRRRKLRTGPAAAGHHLSLVSLSDPAGGDGRRRPELGGQLFALSTREGDDSVPKPIRSLVDEVRREAAADSDGSEADQQARARAARSDYWGRRERAPRLPDGLAWQSLGCSRAGWAWRPATAWWPSSPAGARLNVCVFSRAP